jgi:hypothetical protein
VAHYVVFLSTWRPGQYETRLSWSQGAGMVKALVSAAGLPALGLGVALAAAALARRRVGPWHDYPQAWRAGWVLVILGLGIYLPMPGVSGRYTIPAAWGTDLLLAALVSTLARQPAGRLGQAARVGLCAGLLVVLGMLLGRQDKFAARADLLWQVMTYLEGRAASGPGKCLAWVDGPDLPGSEALHFYWHMRARGLMLPTFREFDRRGDPVYRPETLVVGCFPLAALTGEPEPPPRDRWRLHREFAAPYRGGLAAYRCYLWTTAVGSSPWKEDCPADVTVWRP